MMKIERSSIKSSRRVRKGPSMAPIPEEAAPSCSRRPRSVPMILPLVCFSLSILSLVGSPIELLDSSRGHRSLLTLTSQHVNQYPFDNFLEVDEPFPITQKKVVGFYWQVPRCGGTTLKHILGTCLKRVQAARTSADYCDMNTNKLQTCKTKVGLFVNADPSDHGGIQRCEHMGLVPSGVADVIVSSRILHAATLFDPQHKGRLFTILRHPIERAVSTFYYLQNAYWERHYKPELKEMTLLDYAALPDTANNWMTRWLTGKNAEPHLTSQDVAFAKELLRRKFLILMTDEMSTSIERLLHYMDWRVPEQYYEETKACLLTNTKKDAGQNKNKHLMPDVGTAEYEALKAINDLDMELYEYAKELFKEQASVIRSKRRQHISALFIENNTTSTKTDAVTKASKSSEYEAALAAAALMERPPEEAARKSIEATNNLVAAALMLQAPNNTEKHESQMIASVLAKRYNSAERWQKFRGTTVSDVRLLQQEKSEDKEDNDSLQEKSGESMEESSQVPAAQKSEELKVTEDDTRHDKSADDKSSSPKEPKSVRDRQEEAPTEQTGENREAAQQAVAPAKTMAQATSDESKPSSESNIGVDSGSAQNSSSETSSSQPAQKPISGAYQNGSAAESQGNSLLKTQRHLQVQQDESSAQRKMSWEERISGSYLRSPQ